MLTIRQEQIHALRDMRVRDFARRLMTRIEHSPSPASRQLSEPELLAVLNRGLRYFPCEQHLARYVEIVLRYGDGRGAEDHPAAALELINNENLPAARRLENFERWARAEKANVRR